MSESDDKNQKPSNKPISIHEFDSMDSDDERELLEIADATAALCKPIRKSGPKCAKCEAYGHVAKNCRIDQMTCFKCNDKGHLENRCPIHIAVFKKLHDAIREPASSSKLSSK